MSCYTCEHPQIEYRVVAVNQDGNETSEPLDTCGDGDCVLQAIYYLLTHTRDVDGAMVRQWVVTP